MALPTPAASRHLYLALLLAVLVEGVPSAAAEGVVGILAELVEEGSRADIGSESEEGAVVVVDRIVVVGRVAEVGAWKLLQRLSSMLQ